MNCTQNIKYIFADFSSCLLHKIYWLNYNWTGIFTKKKPQKIKKKKSKIFKNQKKEIQNFQKSKKRNQKFSKIKKKKSKTQKKTQKQNSNDFITHLKNYVCIKITLMFLYSFVLKILIVNFELCAVITLYNSFDNFNSFYVSVSSIPITRITCTLIPNNLDVGLFHFFFLP